MQKEATKLLNTRDWDFEMFGDRNTFARTVMEVIFEKDFQAVLSKRKFRERLLFRKILRRILYAINF